MTIVIAYKHEDKVYMCSDMKASSDNYQHIETYPKIFSVNCKYGRIYIGYTTSFRMAQIIQNELPQYKEPFDIYNVVEFIREKLAEKGFSTIDNNEHIGGQFIIVYCGEMWLVEHNFQYLQPSRNYIAIGAGAEYAYGAIQCGYTHSLTIDDIMISGIDAAKTFCPSCGGYSGIVECIP